MTLTGRMDGDDASTGASYLEIARVLIDHGAQTDADLRELWSRIVFNMLVSNTDDHLRNHGFILVPGKGWRLSDVYEVAPYFRVSRKLADEIVERSRAVVKQWPKIRGQPACSSLRAGANGWSVQARCLSRMLL